jgi:hypothetical protein
MRRLIRIFSLVRASVAKYVRLPCMVPSTYVAVCAISPLSWKRFASP